MLARNGGQVGREIEEELVQAGKDALLDEAERRRRREMIDGLDLKKFAIGGDVEWDDGDAARAASGDKSKSSVVSMKGGDGGKSLKRKLGEATDADAGREGDGGAKQKKIRRGKKAMRG